MARGPRLDMPGSFHHVMARGSEGGPILGSEEDALDFTKRLERHSTKHGILVHAWALMPNHLHLLLESAQGDLSGFMRVVLTGFGVSYNRRNSHKGHVFMGRYKSILVEEERYYLELVRYIHLNPVRAGLIGGLEDLAAFRWTGHRAILSGEAPAWQPVLPVLSHFGPIAEEARSLYLGFLADGLEEGHRDDLTNGTFRVGSRGTVAVEGQRADSRRYDYHGAVLGSREFAVRVSAGLRRRLGGSRKRHDQHEAMLDLRSRVVRDCSISLEALQSSSKHGSVSRARRTIARVLVAAGLSLADSARFLGVTEASIRWMTTRGWTEAERRETQNLLEEFRRRLADGS